MGMYMYPITIKREPQVIKFEKKVGLGGNTTLTLAELKSHGVTEENSFEILEDYEIGLYTLYIYCKRLETQDEVDARVKKEEKYMKNYTKFHAKKKLATGGALEDEMLKDIAFDLGKQHEWIDDSGNWKSDEDKDKAYKLAEVEATKYKDGGKVKGNIYYIITGTH